MKNNINEENRNNNSIIDERTANVGKFIDELMDDSMVSYLAIIVKRDEEGDLNYALYYNNVLEALTLAEIAVEQIEKKL